MYVEKECKGCYALEAGKCLLGYKNEPIFFLVCYAKEDAGYAPVEDCPKPKNKLEYEKCSKIAKI